MNNAKYKFLFMIGWFTVISMQAQTPLSSKEVFTRADTLRGSITPERAWWDVLHYTIGVTPDFLSKYIEGKTEIRFKVLAPGKTMQIDLQEPMQLSKAYTAAYKDLPLRRDGNVYYVSFPKELKTGSVQTLTLVFHGNPRIAKRPPWDGGLPGARRQRMVSLQRPPERRTRSGGYAQYNCSRYTGSGRKRKIDQ